MNFKFITPQRVVFNDTVDMAIIPGAKGEFGVLENHEPLIAKLIAGSLRLYKDGTLTQTYQLREGFAEVGPGGCTVMGIIEG